MAPKPHLRNWNDVQTAIATVTVVTTLGLWNLFATPSKPKIMQTSEPVLPTTEPPVETEAPSVPTAMPQIKIMFTPGVTPTTIVQAQAAQQIPVKKKRRKNNNDGGGSSGSGGGTVSVTQTKTS
jgi:hypothetical protein